MRGRQIGDHAAARRGRQHGVEGADDGEQIGVGELYAFGGTGGAGCVDERERVVGAYSAPCVIEIEVLPAALLEWRGSYPRRRQPRSRAALRGPGRIEHRQELALADHHRVLRMREQVFDLLGEDVL